MKIIKFRAFLLPTVLFDNNRQGRVKDVMRERLKLLATGDWSSLTLGSLQLKAPLQNLEISEADVEKRMTKLLKVGQISKASSSYCLVVVLLVG
jgi:hypothetical protein